MFSRYHWTFRPCVSQTCDDGISLVQSCLHVYNARIRTRNVCFPRGRLMCICNSDDQFIARLWKWSYIQFGRDTSCSLESKKNSELWILSSCEVVLSYTWLSKDIYCLCFAQLYFWDMYGDLYSYLRTSRWDIALTRRKQRQRSQRPRVPSSKEYPCWGCVVCYVYSYPWYS